MDIPVAPVIPQQPPQCKIVIVANKVNEAYCIVGEPEPINALYYTLPGTDIIIDQMSASIFSYPENKGFIAVFKENATITIKHGDSRTKLVYALRPLRRKEYEKYERKELVLNDIPYEAPKQLSEGGYGKVESYPIHQIALKQSKMSKNRGVSSDIIREIGIYRLLKAINCLPKMYNIKLTDVSREMYLEKGSTDLLNILPSLEADINKIRPLMFRIVKCLRASASQGIIHCDLKPNNMILSENGDVLIIDWGLAEIDQSKNQQRPKSTGKVTLPWRAPELLENPPLQTYSYKIDVFALGLIFAELFIGVCPILDVDNEEKQKNIYMRKLMGFDEDTIRSIGESILFTQLINGPSVSDKIQHELVTNVWFESDKKKKMMPDDLADLISHMLELNHQHRYTYDQIIMHPFFQYNSRERIPKLPIFINNMPIIPSIRTVWGTNFLLPEDRMGAFRKIQTFSLKLECFIDTLLLSWQLLDLFMLNTRTTSRMTNLELKSFAMGCFLIATKVYELYDNEYFLMEFIASEYSVMKTLNGNILIPSLFSYFSRQFGPSPRNQDELAELQARYFDVYIKDDIYAHPFSETWKFLAPK